MYPLYLKACYAGINSTFLFLEKMARPFTPVYALSRFMSWASYLVSANCSITIIIIVPILGDHKVSLQLVHGKQVA